MATRIRIFKTQCCLGHDAIASWKDEPPVAYGHYMDMCVFCETCGSYTTLTTIEGILKRNAISEFVSPCDGVLACNVHNDAQLRPVAIIPTEDGWCWKVYNQYYADLAWNGVSVLYINPLDRFAPPEVSAAAASFMVCGGSHAEQN